MSQEKAVPNLEIGKPDVDPTTPSHVRGVKEGNSRRSHRRPLTHPGRSTGIHPKDSAPIDPRMPKLTPA